MRLVFPNAKYFFIRIHIIMAKPTDKILAEHLLLVDL
jgi:hypothetical protein